jgi:hypoxanthine phosphoribosyltransferase
MKKLSWGEVESVAEQLAKKVGGSGFNPDCLIGVTTGGLFPLALLATHIKGKSIFTVTAKKSSDGKKESVSIAYLPNLNLEGKSVLLIDEIAQSGITLNTIAKIIRNRYSVGILKTATMAANKDVCEFWPDYYVLTEEGDWIVFPWEDEGEFETYDLKRPDASG